MSLAERAAGWKDQRAGDVYPRFPARLPYKLRNFLKKRGDARFSSGLEIANRVGFAFDFVRMGRWYLHLNLGWPSFFIPLPTGEEVMGQLREMAQTIEMRCIMEGERVYFEGDKAERAVELLRRTASRPKEKDDV